MCVTSEWTAAKETSGNESAKVEGGPCDSSLPTRRAPQGPQHGQRRDILYASAMYLQKEVSSAGTVGFLCWCVACKYWPYLQKVVQACPELEELLKMHLLLSVMPLPILIKVK